MNTKVVPNLMIYFLVKFQPFPTCVAKEIGKIPPLCFLKNWNSREVETELFDHFNSWIRLRIEYKSCRSWNYLAADKISNSFDEPNKSYEVFRNSWRCTNCLHSMCWVLLCCILVHCILESIWIISLMLELLYFRWWAVLVEPWVVFKQVVVVHRWWRENGRAMARLHVSRDKV